MLGGEGGVGGRGEGKRGRCVGRRGGMRGGGNEDGIDFMRFFSIFFQLSFLLTPLSSFFPFFVLTFHSSS